MNAPGLPVHTFQENEPKKDQMTVEQVEQLIGKLFKLSVGMDELTKLYGQVFFDLSQCIQCIPRELYAEAARKYVNDLMAKAEADAKAQQSKDVTRDM